MHYYIWINIFVFFVIHSGVEYTQKCVHDHFANATEARKQTAMDAMSVVMMLHKQVCPVEMMDNMEMTDRMDNGEMDREPTCNVNASMWCLGKLGQYLSTASAFHPDAQCG